ncbi:MAG: 3-dehydroquinate dehydratase [Ignavibacteriae bacterium HGW-Ignavibacteriae-3]|nr:MAG: 3-dehydroquinate dehydratase [Ignavibacteriae bacterium HGW-Ignavibacteriae-3]
MKILILNGPNLNIIEKRDKNKYGSLSLNEINSSLKKTFPDVIFSFIQSNSEDELIDHIQNCDDYDGLIINPGGLTHSSVGLRDALEILKIPKIEVHLSNLASREEFRKSMITTSKVTGYISGFKEIGYFSAVYTLTHLVSKK